MEYTANSYIAKRYWVEEASSDGSTYEETVSVEPVHYIKESGTTRLMTAEEILADWMEESAVVEKLVSLNLFSLSDIDNHYKNSDTEWCVDIYETSEAANTLEDGTIIDSAVLYESDFLKEIFKILLRQEEGVSEE